MRGLLQTRLGRLYLAATALFAGVVAFRFLALEAEEPPTLVQSLVINSLMPLLVLSLALSAAQRGGLLRRDRLTIAVALAAALALAASGVAIDQRLAMAGFLLDLAEWLLGLTVLALIWSAIGHSVRA
jgi:hypothetical protein